MIKKLSHILFIFLFSFLFTNLATADLGPLPGEKDIDYCVKIVNLYEYPDIVLLSYVTGPMISDDEPQIKQIKNNECLKSGYKFNSMDIYWSDKDDVSLPKKHKLLFEGIDLNHEDISVSDPMKRKTLEYSIFKSSSGEFSLTQSRELREYDNGDAKEIENFINPKIKKNFLKDLWLKLIYFFKGIL